MPEMLLMNTTTTSFVEEEKREEAEKDPIHILWSAENIFRDQILMF